MDTFVWYYGIISFSSTITPQEAITEVEPPRLTPQLQIPPGGNPWQRWRCPRLFIVRGIRPLCSTIRSPSPVAGPSCALTCYSPIFAWYWHCSPTLHDAHLDDLSLRSKVQASLPSFDYHHDYLSDMLNAYKETPSNKTRNANNTKYFWVAETIRKHPEEQRAEHTERCEAHIMETVQPHAG